MNKKIFTSKLSQLEKIKENIVQHAVPEKLFLLSVLYNSGSVENIFCEIPLPEKTINSLLVLVLTKENEKRSVEEIQTIIEHLPEETVSLAAFVFPVHHFNDWLMHNHPFATLVYERAVLFYDANNTPLAVPDAYDETSAQPQAKKVLADSLVQATTLLSGARISMLNKQSAAALTDLRQAAEQIYTCIIWYCTGLKVHTHIPDRLYNIARHFLPQLKEIFSHEKDPEKNLFQWLHEEKINPYKEQNAEMNDTIVLQLIEQIQNLIAQCKTLLSPATINI